MFRFGPKLMVNHLVLNETSTCNVQNVQVAVSLLTILKGPIVHTRTEWSRADTGIGSDSDVVFNVLLQFSQYY